MNIVLEPRSALYNTVWRWHFYAALFTTPFILVFSITGSIYLFKPQIENWLYRDLYNIPPIQHTLSPDAQVKAALSQFPKAQVEAYIPPSKPNNSALIRLIPPSHQEVTVAINPETGAVLGEIKTQQRPLQIIRELHGKLLAGRNGQMIQELAASWALVLVITGLYLWWPRQNKPPLQGILLPRLKASSRLFWRHLHAVTGFWISGLLIFLILTGLPWSVVSGNLIHQFAAKLGKGSPDTGLGWDSSGSRTIQSAIAKEDWATRHIEQLAGHSVSTPLGKSLSVQQIMTIAHHLPATQKGFEVRLPVNRHGVYTILTNHETNPANIAYIHLDQYTGKLVKAVYWKDFGPLAQAISMGVVLHEGQYFGLPNQLLGLAACLGLILMSLAGIIMWWQRRPVGKLGVPPTPSHFKLSAGIIALIILMGFLMPLMGLSLVAIILIEGIIQKVFTPTSKANS